MCLNPGTVKNDYICHNLGVLTYQSIDKGVLEHAKMNFSAFNPDLFNLDEKPDCQLVPSYSFGPFGRTVQIDLETKVDVFCKKSSFS